MPYKVIKSVNRDGVAFEGAEVDVVAADGSQSLGRTTTNANGLFSVNTVSYSGEVFASVYISGIKPQVKRYKPVFGEYLVQSGDTVMQCGNPETNCSEYIERDQ